MPSLIWRKQFSRTDAQQPTEGGIVPYLRLTNGSLVNEDYKTWFRYQFFAGADWRPGHVGKEQGVETANVTVSVTINGASLGDHNFLVSHGPDRKANNNTANTWLHWPEAIQATLVKTDTTGWRSTLTRLDNDSYELDIRPQ